jgi:nucleoside 2-deoxyribosyltransferase
MTKVYLAGPVSGLSWKEATLWRKEVTKHLWQDWGIEAIDPLEGKAHLQFEKAIPLTTEHVRDQAPAILDAALYNVMRADMLLVHFNEGSTVSIGTVMEIAWARYLHKPVVVVSDSVNNVHNHPMITASVTAVVSSLTEALAIIGPMLSTAVPY